MGEEARRSELMSVFFFFCFLREGGFRSLIGPCPSQVVRWLAIPANPPRSAASPCPYWPLAVWLQTPDSDQRQLASQPHGRLLELVLRLGRAIVVLKSLLPVEYDDLNFQFAIYFCTPAGTLIKSLCQAGAFFYVSREATSTSALHFPWNRYPSRCPPTHAGRPLPIPSSSCRTLVDAPQHRARMYFSKSPVMCRM